MPDFRHGGKVGGPGQMIHGLHQPLLVAVGRVGIHHPHALHHFGHQPRKEERNKRAAHAEDTADDEEGGVIGVPQELWHAEQTQKDAQREHHQDVHDQKKNRSLCDLKEFHNSFSIFIPSNNSHSAKKIKCGNMTGVGRRGLRVARRAENIMLLTCPKPFPA